MSELYCFQLFFSSKLKEKEKRKFNLFALNCTVSNYFSHQGLEIEKERGQDRERERLKRDREGKKEGKEGLKR